MSMKRAKLSFLDLEAGEGGTDSSSDDQQSLDSFVEEEYVSTAAEEEIYQDLGLDLVEDRGESSITEIVARAKQRAAESNATRSCDYGDEYDLEHPANALKPLTSTLWELTVKPKTESHLSAVLNREYSTLKSREEKSIAETGVSLQRDNEVGLFSFQAFHVKGLHGRVFVISDDLKRAAQRLTRYLVDKTVFRNFARVALPDNLALDFGATGLEYLQHRASRNIQRHQWVRVRRGLYHKDIALVIDPQPRQHPDRPLLAVVPRFDEESYSATYMGSTAAVAHAAKGSKPTTSPMDSTTGAHAGTGTPSPMDSTAAVAQAAKSKKPTTSPVLKRKRRQAARVLGREAYDHMRRRGVFRVFRKRVFLDGLEIIKGNPSSLDLRPVIRDDEIQPFVNLELSHQASLNHIRKSMLTGLQPGDRAYVFRGHFEGLTGTVLELDSIKGSVTMEVVELDEVPFECDLDDIRRIFLPGMWVRVAWGVHLGRVGVVISETSSSGTADIWSPHSPIESILVPRTSQEKIQDQERQLQHALENSASEEFTVYQEFLERSPEPISFEEQRHPFAPGVISSASTQADQDKRERIATREREKTKETSRSHLQTTPAPSSAEPTIFTFGRTIGVQGKSRDLDRGARPDPRIGKDAEIIATDLKGYWGRITDISVDNVTLNLPGRLPPFATVKLNQAVCLDQLGFNMAGEKLKVPLKMPQIYFSRPLQPSRPPTPEALPATVSSAVKSTSSQQVDLGEAAFLLDDRIARFGSFRVYVGFDLHYDGGKWNGRYGHTDKFPGVSITDAAFEVGASPEIFVHWTANRDSQPIKKSVPIKHLTRAPPSKKGQEVLILRDGPLWGEVGRVESFSRKEKSAVVVVIWNKHTISWQELCRVSTDP